MRKTAVFLLIGATFIVGAVSAKVHSRVTRPDPYCSNVPCWHLYSKIAIAEAAIKAYRQQPSYLVLGDSITDIAHWRPICGLHPMVVGVGAARTDTFLPYARKLVDDARPNAVVVALGTNDIRTLRRLGPYQELIDGIGRKQPIVAVPIHQAYGLDERIATEANAIISSVVPHVAKRASTQTVDGVHLTAEDYRVWTAAIEDELCKAIEADKSHSKETSAGG